jgi:DNA-binding NtrC family response regulator
LVKKIGVECLTTDDTVSAIGLLSRERPDIVVTEFRMPEMDGIEIIQAAQKVDPEIMVFVYSGSGSLDTAVRAIKAGAFDYIEKADLSEKLESAIKDALKNKERGTRKSISGNVAIFDKMVGKSKAITDVFRIVLKISNSDSNVLLYGESGTGKELLARSIHAQSRRSARAFIPVDCVALPENLLESELFGYERGAFTGATSMRRGLLELADHGTLFLDEICELAPYLQAKLLRVLQEREFRRIGGKELLKSDLRIVCATNKVPIQAVEANLLREDLYYRLNVIPVKLPPLRDRKEDVPLLSKHFLQKVSKFSGKDGLSLNPEAMDALRKYEWPGNIRELRNLIEQLVSLTDKAEIGLSDLPDYIASNSNGKRDSHYHFSSEPYEQAKRHFEEKYFLSLIKACNGNISKAAKKANINRKTMYRKIDALKLRG